MCHEDVETIECNAKCLMSLACGHHCTKTCKEECNPCMEMVKIKEYLLYSYILKIPLKGEKTEELWPRNKSLLLICRPRAGAMQKKMQEDLRLWP
jgi:hypothetical protein